MATSYTMDDPTGEIVQALAYGSGGTGSYRGIVMARIALATTSTANAATNWINPESGTVAARAFVVFTTAGTGTIEVGRGSDGTGSASDIILAGTMTTGLASRGADLGVVGTTGSGATAATRTEWLLFGPGGTGTNNSVVMKHSDTITSTAVGALIVQYFLIG